MQKVYDTINWSFLKDILLALDFLESFVKIVMESVYYFLFDDKRGIAWFFLLHREVL